MSQPESMSAVPNINLRRVVRGAGYELVRDSVLPVSRVGTPDVQTLYKDGKIFAEIWTSGCDRFMHLSSVATFICSLGERRVTATAEQGVSQTAVDEAFHLFVVPLLLYFAGCEVLHASAVQTTTGIVGFCAAAGTGKSTLAYGLSGRGFPLWADDALALDVSQKPRALLLGFNPRLRPPAAKFFETLSVRPRLKSPAQVEFPPLAALAVISRTVRGKDAIEIERLSGGGAFNEVVRHAYRLGLKTDYVRRKMLIENYMKIAASVPVFDIRFRPGFRRFPVILDRVSELLDDEFGQTA